MVDCARFWQASVSLSLLLVLAGACDGSKKQTLKDTEGRHFELTCSKDRICSLSRATDQKAKAKSDEAKADGDKKDEAKPVSFQLRSVGRVVGVCGPLPHGQSAALPQCRPLECQQDSECPPAEGLDHGVCINRLCTEPSHAIHTEDAVLLCLAGTGTEPQTPLQAERFALGLNCGTPCTVPRVCRQL
jgi:hypothetical protein